MIDMTAIEEAIATAEAAYGEIGIFMQTWVSFFQTDKILNKGVPPAVHSVRFRIKDSDHLRDKIVRKQDQKGISITSENIFDQVTDLAGVRVIHLHMDQFPLIHDSIIRRVEMFKYHLWEKPKAYTWDPENVIFFEKLGIDAERKESSYTSVHYTIRPFDGSFISCEIQVRTLFEEAWGEIEHAINYPSPTKNSSCKEQIAVLAKLVGAGTRLADSIFRTHRTDKP